MKNVLATWNPEKIKWLRQGFSKLGFSVITLSEYEFGDVDDVEEVGQTCAENAIIKVDAIKSDGNSIIIGEDSGLFIEYLNGFPGVKTARWMKGTDEDRAKEILKKMESSKERAAYFESVIAAKFPDGTIKHSLGRLQGTISQERRGSLGEGYARIFEVKDGLTIAEIGVDTVAKFDHRTISISEMNKKIKLSI